MDIPLNPPSLKMYKKCIGVTLGHFLEFGKDTYADTWDLEIGVTVVNLSFID